MPPAPPRVDPRTLGMNPWDTQADVARELRRQAEAATEAAEAALAAAAEADEAAAAAAHAVGHVPPAMPAHADPHQPTAEFPHGWYAGSCRAPELLGFPRGRFHELRGGGADGEWLPGQDILRRPLPSWRSYGGYGYRLFIGGLAPGGVVTTETFKDWLAAAGGRSDIEPMIEYPGVTEQRPLTKVVSAMVLLYVCIV